MGKSRNPRRKRKVDPVTHMLLQVMPRRRVRLDPTQVPQIAVWLMSACSGWERALAAPDVAKSDRERLMRANHDARCRTAIGAVNEIVGRLRETQSADDIDAAHALVSVAELIRKGLVEGPQETARGK